MSGDPNKLSQFWQELKRRRVIHIITVYATSAFVLIELVNNLAEPLNLPANLPTIVIVILAVGFPLAIILSWLYDLTSEGMEKTKPLSEVEDGGKPAVPNAWKIATYVSFVVIIGLVVLNFTGSNKLMKAGTIQSLVILPFENFTGDDQLEWFVSGMHAKLIRDVQRISGFEVINRTSSNVYKNVDMRVQEIASELDVDAVIETDVTCLGDSICFQIKVISAFPEEKTIWIADYKEAKSQIPNLYNRITKQIADEVKIELTADEDMLLAETREVDPEAIDAYMRGLFYLDKIDRDALQKASEYFNKAIEIAPDWALPYAGLVEVGAYQMQMWMVPPSIAIPKIYENLNKALELDLNSSISHYTIAVIAVWTEWNWEKGEKEFLKSLELNPSNALCRMFYAHLLMILHRSDEAIHQANQALKLDPLRPFLLGLYGVVMNSVGDHQSAIVQSEKALSIEPNHNFAKGTLAHAYLAVGDYDGWYEIYKRRLVWTDDEYLASLDSIFQEHGYLSVIEDRIKVNEEVKNSGGRISEAGQGWRYLQLEKYDKAMDCYEKAYEFHSPEMPYISTLAFNHEQLKYNPRYIELLKKMNLPLPEE